MRPLFYLSIFCLLLSQSCWASPALEPVKVSLISEGNSIAKGFKFRVGALFQIEPGWHIYWKDSGDSGLPTRVRLETSDALSAGELLWPQHEEFELPGKIQGLGYSGETLLFSEINVPDNVLEGTDELIKAKINWLSCSPKVCIPGNKTLELRLPVKPLPNFQNKELFDKWQSKLPS